MAENVPSPNPHLLQHGSGTGCEAVARQQQHRQRLTWQGRRVTMLTRRAMELVAP